ncbi:MAG: hypothetical protein IIA59_07650 [Candidatus Marinimicrobia bacterium]|nr:hypothetical protein [Candidatus Neomarinimicrobiota bacterium]
MKNAGMQKGASSNRELRRYGLAMTTGFGVIGGLLAMKQVAFAPYLLAVAAGFLIVAILAPQALRPIERVWMKVAHVLNFIVTRIILTLVYIFLVTPTRFLLLALGKKTLDLRIDSELETYWKRANSGGTADRPDKPY